MRTGIGWDVHRLIKGEDLILGGIKIPFSLGLKGHSDADVLLHAVMDAILGALALGDIGQHFTDNDDRYQDISSLVLLKKVTGLMIKKDYLINNLDMIIIAEKPKIQPYRQKIITRIAGTLKLTKNKINLKATTAEGLGFIGQSQGIVAQAVVTLVRK